MGVPTAHIRIRLDFGQLSRVLIKCFTNKAQLGEFQYHPILRGELQGKVLHCGKVVWLGHYVILQLKRSENIGIKMLEIVHSRVLLDRRGKEPSGEGIYVATRATLQTKLR